MKTAIKTLEEKIKDNKIADFSKFYPTGNQEVAHFAEQYCEEKLKWAAGLLKEAKCPNCDGSGTIVSSVYPSGEIKDIEPCRWCWEKEQFLDQTNKQ